MQRLVNAVDVDPEMPVDKPSVELFEVIREGRMRQLHPYPFTAQLHSCFLLPLIDVCCFDISPFGACRMNTAVIVIWGQGLQCSVSL